MKVEQETKPRVEYQLHTCILQQSAWYSLQCSYRGFGQNIPLCSCEGPGFNSQHPRGSLELSEIPGPGDVKASSGLCEHWACVMYMCRHNTQTHKHKFLKERKEADTCTPGQHVQPSNSRWLHAELNPSLGATSFCLSMQSPSPHLSHFPNRQEKVREYPRCKRSTQSCHIWSGEKGEGGGVPRNWGKG